MKYFGLAFPLAVRLNLERYGFQGLQPLVPQT